MPIGFNLSYSDDENDDGYGGDDNAKNIAIIRGGPKNGDLLQSSDYARDNFISLRNGNFEIYPDDLTREIYLIAGASGSGKSTITRQIALNYYDLFPDNNIYLFSRVKSDPAFLDLIQKGIILEIELNDEFAEMEIDIIKNIEESLVIFDDVDTFTNKKLMDKINSIRLQIMELGRHKSIYTCITSHLINSNDRKFSRTVLNELSRLIVFPQSGSKHQIEYALKTYFGMNKKQILNTNERWICIGKNYPQYILSSKRCELIK